jgi:hypothetical protein
VAALADDAPVEDQADLVGAADVEVVVQRLLEEHLGQRELGLQDRQLVAVTGGLVLVGERVGQDPQPLAQQRLDLRRAEAVADLLHRGHVVARGDPLSSGSKPIPALAAWRLAHSLPLRHNLAV